MTVRFSNASGTTGQFHFTIDNDSYVHCFSATGITS